MIIIRKPFEIKQPIVCTIGMFDGVHLGHCSLIEHVRREAATRRCASAVVTFATHPREVLHPESPMQLLTTYDERMQRLSATGIDYAIVLDFSSALAQLSAREFLALLHDNFGMQAICIGYDHRFGHNRSEGFPEYCAYGRELGIDVIESTPFFIPEGQISSSAIRRALAAGKVEQANAMAGYRYRIQGKVVDGKKLGRTLGFPTANITVNDCHKLLPAVGVYAVCATLPDGTTRGGMMNIGFRPTLNGERSLSLEVHLFDFDGNLYGQDIAIDFIAFMRNEEKYDSLEALQQAIKNDAVAVKKVLARECNLA